MDRYVRIAAALREAGIEPVVTLHHFTNPGWLAEEGSWEDPSTLGEFLRFAERAVRALRGHARVFVTFNEPNVFIAGGYLGGVMPPHHTDHEIHDTLYFWNHRQKYSSHFDAWEVANRTDLFSVVSLSNYPILANGDFHKAGHLYSWKTLLPCLKNVEAVKECIRDNRGVAITMFPNGTARE